MGITSNIPDLDPEVGAHIERKIEELKDPNSAARQELDALTAHWEEAMRPLLDAVMRSEHVDGSIMVY
jgi:hypothetical protein